MALKLHEQDVKYFFNTRSENSYLQVAMQCSIYSIIVAFVVGVLIVSWPSVNVCLVLDASCSVYSSHMVVRNVGLRLSSGILG